MSRDYKSILFDSLYFEWKQYGAHKLIDGSMNQVLKCKEIPKTWFKNLQFFYSKSPKYFQGNHSWRNDFDTRGRPITELMEYENSFLVVEKVISTMPSAHKTGNGINVFIKMSGNINL